MALLFPLQVLLATFVGSAVAGSGVVPALIVNAAVTAFLFALLPTLWLLRSRVRPLFELRFDVRTLLFVPGLILLALTSWIPAHEILVLSQGVFGQMIDEETLKRSAGTIEKLGQTPLWIVLLTLAVVPAVSEEIYFRGLLLRAFRSRQGAWRATLFAAIAFGGFHVFATMFTPERFFPTALLGVMLGYVYCRTRNLLASTAVHCAHNGLLLTAASYHEELAKWGFGLGGDVADDELAHLPIGWIVTGLAGVTLGIVAIEIARRLGRKDEPVTSPAAPSAHE
jgi:membrane protease YdiL (CAAX protease family)